jgi:hypothetical protein
MIAPVKLEPYHAVLDHIHLEPSSPIRKPIFSQSCATIGYARSQRR